MSPEIEERTQSLDITARKETVCAEVSSDPNNGRRVDYFGQKYSVGR
jgi:hypothetical protein